MNPLWTSCDLHGPLLKGWGEWETDNFNMTNHFKRKGNLKSFFLWPKISNVNFVTYIKLNQTLNQTCKLKKSLINLKKKEAFTWITVG
jgi:hypothetical protein